MKNETQKKSKILTGSVLAVSVCFLVLLVGITAWLSAPRQAGDSVQTRSVTLTDAGFDTPITFQATCSEDDFNKYLQIVKDTFVKYNQLFDNYNEYDGVNSIMTVNEQAATHPVEVDPHVIDVINEAAQAHEINPKFDITEGRLLSLWHDARESETPYLPSADAIEQARIHTGLEGVIIDGNTISFTDDTISLDLGAIAKGYTAELCKEELEAAGLTSGFINAGGNVVLIGEKADGQDWVIGIQNPNSNTSLVRFTTKTPTCLVTSGDYQRYMEIDGQRYSHIIDPDTGYPATFVRSVTVINEDSAFADAMSTALFCMSVEDGMALCQEMNLEAIWFTDQGAIDLEPSYTSEGFDIYMTPGIADQVSLSN